MDPAVVLAYVTAEQESGNNWGMSTTLSGRMRAGLAIHLSDALGRDGLAPLSRLPFDHLSGWPGNLVVLASPDPSAFTVGNQCHDQAVRQVSNQEGSYGHLLLCLLSAVSGAMAK